MEGSELSLQNEVVKILSEKKRIQELEKICKRRNGEANTGARKDMQESIHRMKGRR